MCKKFFANLKREIEITQNYDLTRIKVDWLCPDALGLPENHLDN